MADRTITDGALSKFDTWLDVVWTISAATAHVHALKTCPIISLDIE